MIPPDKEIYELEQRIALRRSQVKRYGREAGARTLQALASPVALLGAAVLGFIIAGGLSPRRKEPPHPERRKSDHLKSAKATGIAGMLMPVAMWLVRAQWGSPMQLAQAVLQKMQKKKAMPSPRSDSTVRRWRVGAP